MSSLIVTLRRGLAGKKVTDIATVHSLGLFKPGQCIEQPNSSVVRGQINKARHLLRVELKEEFLTRMAAAAERAAPREPLVVKH